MRPDLLPHLRDIRDAFALPGRMVKAEAFGTGHINDTFLLTEEEAGGQRGYVMQRINHLVFTDPPRLMENFARVCEHLRGKVADPARETLRLIPTRSGEFVVHFPEWGYFRLMDQVLGTVSYDVIESHAMAEEGARAFAHFQGLLVDLPGARLHETIPAFHDTPKRWRTLQDAVQRDPLNRAAACRQVIDFALNWEANTRIVSAAMADGRVPERITHNDTKISNILFDQATQRGLCVIDLDTVMPGSVLFDLGDLVRSSGGNFQENEKDLSKVFIDPVRFEHLVRGYLNGAGNFLTPTERELLAFSGRLLTYETGIRFLTDHLVGDTYFRIHYPGENFDRARAQLHFVANMEQHQDQLEAIVRRYA
jgi:hypothetical protein